MLPKEVREELEKRIVASGFSGYRALEKWLREQGFEILKGSINRHGVKLEERLEALQRATQQARAIVEASPDDEGAINDALVRLVQERLFNVLLKLGDLDPTKVHIGSIAKSVAELARASLAQKKWTAEVREKLAAKVAAANERVTQAVKSGGLSPDAEKTIRAALLDIDV